MYDGSNVTGSIEFGKEGKLRGLGQEGTWKVRDSREILIKLGDQEQVLEFDDVTNEAVVIDPPTIPMSRLVYRSNSKEDKPSQVSKTEDEDFHGFGGVELDPETRDKMEKEHQERLCIDIIGWNNYY